MVGHFLYKRLLFKKVIWKQCVSWGKRKISRRTEVVCFSYLRLIKFIGYYSMHFMNKICTRNELVYR